MSNQPYEKRPWYVYFEVNGARFKKNIFTRKVYLFAFNQPTGNRWNEPGYGWGVWVPL